MSVIYEQKSSGMCKAIRAISHTFAHSKKAIRWLIWLVRNLSNILQRARLKIGQAYIRQLWASDSELASSPDFGPNIKLPIQHLSAKYLRWLPIRGVFAWYSPIYMYDRVFMLRLYAVFDDDRISSLRLASDMNLDWEGSYTLSRFNFEHSIF
jgi:hypothetical protein